MRPTRERIRSGAYVYFVSTQTAGRKPFFRHERWAQLMVATLEHYARTAFQLHAYVLMPDHLHILLTPNEAIEKSMQCIKGGFSFRAKREFGWKAEIWQPGFTDHRIRDAADWQHHLDYLKENPVKAQLEDDAVLYRYINIYDHEFPQGLKPPLDSPAGVRAEARTLQSSRP